MQADTDTDRSRRRRPCASSPASLFEEMKLVALAGVMSSRQGTGLLAAATAISLSIGTGAAAADVPARGSASCHPKGATTLLENDVARVFTYSRHQPRPAHAIASNAFGGNTFGCLFRT